MAKKYIRTLKIELDTETGEFVRFVNLKEVIKGMDNLTISDWFNDISGQAEMIRDNKFDKFYKNASCLTAST